MTEGRLTAVVTGASRGIGRAIALRLAADYHVVAIARSHGSLGELAQEIEAAGGSCDAVTLDITDWPAVAGALADRRADVLVHNAGVGVVKPLVELSPEEWHRMTDTNFSALYHVTRHLLPGMIARQAGHIVLLGSIAGRSAFIGGAGYAATKHAVMGFAESLMLEVREHGVKVSVVSPGSVATGFSSGGVVSPDSAWKLQPDDVASAVVAVLDTPASVLIHRVEVRTLNPPPPRRRK